MIKYVATDVDGTLTIRRGDVRISIEAINGIRLLEANGIKVSLISGNSLPVTLGLRGYIGASGPAIAENGCIIYFHGYKHVCNSKPPDELKDIAIKMGLVESWQNKFRFHDLAFFIPKNLDKSKIKDYINEIEKISNKYGFKVLWSGYALHILPENGGKGQGVKIASELLGYKPEEVATIGDGENDVDMLKFGNFSACPQDASEEVKGTVKYIASKPGGEGFLEIAKFIINKQKSV
ncbi:MAG: phosphoglycolate phosphatase [Caldisphaera sp.]|jgi:phosphoglycolate phosphatase (TIGR01487 family)|uniref:phosphoglycolate phosphatase n=1 Tax=Caldisphaera sp. TaxID=2060322 RepID=UPI000CAE4E80|nr:MAG: phosphoglycolate phosphatase [Caldisphaera sp.]